MPGRGRASSRRGNGRSEREEPIPRTSTQSDHAQRHEPESDHETTRQQEVDHPEVTATLSAGSTFESGLETLTQEESGQTQQKKRVRVSKKDIPEYNWTQEADLLLGDFVKQHPQLYDKKERDWLNVAAKARLWEAAGQELTPHATGAQCKKQYENMRTRVGKILKKENKSGSGQPDRTAREHDLLDAWGFLTQHIARGPTLPSEEFSQLPYTSDDNGEESSTAGEIPAFPQGKGKGRRPSTQSNLYSPVSVSVDTLTTDHSQLRDTVLQILTKANHDNSVAPLTGQDKIVRDFCCLLEDHMRRIPEARWHRFQIDCLNLTHRYQEEASQPIMQPQLWPPQPAQQQQWHQYSQQQHHGQQTWQQQQPCPQQNQWQYQQPLQLHPPQHPQIQQGWAPSLTWSAGHPSTSTLPTPSTSRSQSAQAGTSSGSQPMNNQSRSPQLFSPSSLPPLALTPGSAECSFEGNGPLDKDYDQPLKTPCPSSAPI